MNKHGFQALLIVLIAGLLCFSCRGKKDEAETGQTLAKVNKRTITPEDFQISIDLLYPPEERPRFATPEGKKSMMQQLVIMELFYQEGVAQGIEQDPRFKQVIENYKRYLVYNTLMNRGITAASIADYYRTNFAHVAIIFLSKPEKATEKEKADIKARAEKLRDDVAKGAKFADVAKKYSQHPSSKFGGDAGPVTRGDNWENEMIDAAVALRENEPLSPVVEAPKGYYIVQLIQPGNKLSLETMRPEVRRSIYIFLLRQNYATYAAQLQSQASVNINAETLNSIRLDGLAGPGGSPLQPLAPEGVPGVDPIANP